MNHHVVGQLHGLELWRVYKDDDKDDDNNATNNKLASSLLVKETACALSTQWPRTEENFYRDKLVHHPAHTSISGNYQLPCSYLLVRSSRNVVGHGRLTECFEGASGSAAAATYILIFPNHQGCGLGRTLMQLLEHEATRLHYHYVYLWTVAAVPFYLKQGYTLTERVSLNRACLKTLAVERVSVLEAMLQSRHSRLPGASNTKIQETITLPPSDGMTQDADDVWLRKRLVESVGSTEITMQERRVEMLAAITKTDYHGWQWEYRLVSVPWQPQVGPSCGLAALRMLRDYYLISKNETDGVPQAMPSLLTQAQTMGYSQDGEVFDATNLQLLAESVCGLDCEMWSFAVQHVDDVVTVLHAGATVILPYDSSPGTKLPGILEGQNAHYGIIVGLLLAFPDTAEPCTETKLAPHIDRPTADACETLLLVQHSLSRKLAIAPWSLFYESNKQLDSIDRKRFREASNLDLKDRLIVVNGRS